jgi:putative endonuclease
MRRLYVYIMANSSRTLYVGVTNDLRRRVREHRAGTGKGAFTARYRINRLVYFEYLGPPLVAIAREKQIKAYDREKRVQLVRSMNPRWSDLAEGWSTFPFGTPEQSWRTIVHRAQEARERKLSISRKRK